VRATASAARERRAMLIGILAYMGISGVVESVRIGDHDPNRSNRPERSMDVPKEG